MCVSCSFLLREILPYGDQLHLLKLYGYNQTLAIMITIGLNAPHNCIEHALAPVFYFSAFLILELALVRIVIMCNAFIKRLLDSTFLSRYDNEEDIKVCLYFLFKKHYT